MKELITAQLIVKEDFFEGKRVIIDFMDEFDSHDYVLVGNTMKGFFPIVSENHESENYKPRKFRFNIGSLNQYILTGEDTVKYVDELMPGDEVLVFGADGKHRTLHIARIKKEIRPFTRLCASDGNNTYVVIVQNGSTVALRTEDGIKAVCNMSVNDNIMVSEWNKASHLGNVVEEYVEEY